MSVVSIILEGLSEDEAENIFDAAKSGFRMKPSDPGRSTRYSYLGDAVVIAGQIVSLANFSHTLYKLLIKSKTPSQKEISIKVKRADGKEVSISGTDQEAVLKALQEVDEK